MSNHLQKVKIPLIIMQTWKTDKVPNHWIPSQKGIKTHMPHWKYVLMTDEDNRNFCKKHFPDFLPYYDAFEYPIMKADAIRYMFLYVNGGLYIDLDIEVRKPLDDLFYEDHNLYLVRSGTFGSYYTNAFMASKPGQSFWLECIEEMKKPYKTWQVGKHLKVMRSTGPLMLTSMVNNQLPTIGELPSDLLGCSVCDPKPFYKEDNYVAILEGSSWIGSDTKTYIFFTCHWKYVIFFIIFMVVILTIAKFTKKK
jgi:inositol phosphorylceramide mannosyltransferase catalytic subunit